MEVADKEKFNRLLKKNKPTKWSAEDKQVLIGMLLIGVASISLGYWTHSIPAGTFFAAFWFLVMRLKNGTD